MDITQLSHRLYAALDGIHIVLRAGKRNHKQP
jgi:hypothetical protein